MTVKTKTALNRLLKLVDSLNICAGHPEDHFLDLADSRKGKFQSAGNSTVAFTDTYYPVSLNGKEYSRTIRTSACEILVHGPKCDVCKKYRSSLRSQQLYREAKIDSIPDYQKYLCLVFDEVKVKEDLVYYYYDKHSAELLGFVKIRDINDHLSKFKENDSTHIAKPHLATHILTFMVSGILSNLEFLYVSFPCTSVSGDELYSFVWGCVRRLESCGLKVIALTCDGASANRKFFKLHKSSTDDIIYKTINPYADEDRPVFFISDPPHLIKTVRNCWANSYSHSWARNFWVSDQSSIAL